MNKKLTRTLAGAMSLMFMGQVMIFGDGSAQGLLHADTIASAAEVIWEKWIFLMLRMKKKMELLSMKILQKTI